MEINIIGWSSRGLRCPDITLDLAKSGGLKGVTLIQMPNGTGKTTTLELIKACLNGSATHWGKDVVGGFRSRHNPGDSGHFALNLKLDSEYFTIEIDFDFLERSCCYRTSKASSGGIRDGWRIPADLRPYCNKQFIDLVVFDGELASRLLDRRQTEAERAIDALCDLSFIMSEIPSWADSLWREAKRDGALDDAQISRIRNGLAEVKEQRKQQERKLESARRSLESLIKQREGFEDARRDELDKHEELRRNYEFAEQERANAKRNLDHDIERAITGILRPSSTFPSVGKSLISLKEGLDKARLPEASSRQFFEEIVEQDRCICGTPFSNEMKMHVREKMGDYLSSETTAVLNVMKDSIIRSVDLTESIEGGFQSVLVDLKASLAGFYRAGQKAEQAQSEYNGPGAEQMRGIERKIGELSAQIDAAEKAISQLGPKVLGLKNKEGHLEDELAEAQNAKKLKLQVAKLKQICLDAVDIVREKVKGQMLVECNEMLPGILKDNPVSLSGIDGAIQLLDQESASVGQTLAVGYVFLARLFSHAAHSFPFVVDSPVGSLDNSVRAEIGSLIPSLGRQFVAFTISSERAGFVNGLEDVLGGDISFLTIKRSDSDGNVASLMVGREAFFNFHSNKEVGDV